MWHFHEPRKLSTKHVHSRSHSPRSRSRRNSVNHQSIDLHANGHTSTDQCLSFDPAHYVMVNKNGYLWKESSTLNNVVSLAWRQKWFSLNGTLLSYYDHRDDIHPKEVIQLASQPINQTVNVSDNPAINLPITQTINQPNLLIKKDTRPDKPFCFSIMQPTQFEGFVDTTVITIAAQSEAEMNGWIDAIRNNLDHDSRLARAYQDRIDHLEAIIQTLQEQIEASKVEARLNALHSNEQSTNQSTNDQSTNQSTNQLNNHNQISIMEAFRMKEMIGLLQQENRRLKNEIQRIRFDNSINPATYRGNQSNSPSTNQSTNQLGHHLTVSTSFPDNSPTHVAALERLTASTPVPRSPLATDNSPKQPNTPLAHPSTNQSTDQSRSSTPETPNNEVADLKRELAATRAQLDRTKAERKILKDECLRLRRVLAEANQPTNQSTDQSTNPSTNQPTDRIVVTQPSPTKN